MNRNPKSDSPTAPQSKPSGWASSPVDKDSQWAQIGKRVFSPEDAHRFHELFKNAAVLAKQAIASQLNAHQAGVAFCVAQSQALREECQAGQAVVDLAGFAGLLPAELADPAFDQAEWILKNQEKLWNQLQEIRRVLGGADAKTSSSATNPVN